MPDYTPSPELQKLREEKEKAEKQIRHAEHQIRILEHEAKALERKARNRRVFTRGGMLESFLQKPELLTDEDVFSVLKLAFHPQSIGDYVARLVRERENEIGKEADDGTSRKN